MQTTTTNEQARLDRAFDLMGFQRTFNAGIRAASITGGKFTGGRLVLASDAGPPAWGKDITVTIYTPRRGGAKRLTTLEYAEDYCMPEGDELRAGYAFENTGTTITDPFSSTCSRFRVEPEKEYGIPRILAQLLMHLNEITKPSPDMPDAETQAMHQALESLGYAVEDTGGGCQWYAKELEDGRLIHVSDEAQLPVWGDGMWVGISASRETACEGDIDEYCLEFASGKWTCEAQTPGEVSALLRALNRIGQVQPSAEDILAALAAVQGEVTIADGIATLPDGTSLSLTV